ncbi:MAG TPA: amylo-alpha-1,6-glucosidase [Thermoanaerobaculia bacterium]
MATIKDRAGARETGEAEAALSWSGPELKSPGWGLVSEWYETDGLGGFAGGTAAGARTRRSHCWYAPALPPPRRRWVLVSGTEEEVSAGGSTEAISTRITVGGYETDARKTLTRFALSPFPTWRHETERFAIERRFCLVRDRSISILRWANVGEHPLTLAVRPLLALRGSHALQRENPDFETQIVQRGEASWVKPLAYLPRLHLRAVGAVGLGDPSWFRGFHYPAEAARGVAAEEDLWSPLAWTWNLDPGDEGWALFSLEEVAGDPEHLVETERRRRQAFTRTGDALFDEAARRAETFLVEGDYRDGTVLAGLPYLADRGRDTMIAATGLALASGRYAAAARALNTFAARRREGLLPARFAGEEGDPEYASIDTSLWFILAVEWFGKARRNPTRPSPLLGAVRAILEAFRHGTRHGIRVGPDGLLAGSDPLRPLTWMDAVVDGEPVTPRRGRPVEANALWHAALKSAARLERLAGEEARARELEAEAWHVSRRFAEAFWNPERECLYDVVGDEGPDGSLRPNQILAVALTPDLLPPHRARAVYWTVRRRLRTPYGLRTLDARDPRYRPHAGSTDRERDLAAHQGCAWPWLLGGFADAHARVLGRDSDASSSMREWLRPLRDSIRQSGLGSISEMFDGEPPHEPRGAPHRAISVAEILRVLYVHLQQVEVD